MLQDEMTFQRIEVLLDIQAKKIIAEIAKLREELSQAKEEMRKEIRAVRQDTPFQQAGPARVQMYADAPPHAEPQPIPRYAQESQAPRYARSEQEDARAYVDELSYHGNHAGAAKSSAEPAPENRPIDRNGVAPADVSIEKFFYTGSKRR